MSKGEPVQVTPNPLQGNVPAILSVFLHNQSLNPMIYSSNLVRIPAQSINQTYAIFQQSCPYSCTINQSNLCYIPAILSVFLHNQSIKPMLYSSNPVRIPEQSIYRTYAVFQQSCPYSWTINQSNLYIVPANLSVLYSCTSIKPMPCSSNPVRTLCAIQCCGSGSGIQCFLTPGSGMGKKSESRSGMNNPDHISENSEFFGLQYIVALY
jgi:hypothetical protein